MTGSIADKIKYCEEREMWYLRSPAGVCIFFKTYADALRSCSMFAAPGSPTKAA